MDGFDRTTETRHIVGLDLIRFVAAGMVMLFHLAFWSWAGNGTVARLMPNLPTFPELTPVAWVGWVGVEIFFVLSGFVIAYSADGSSAFAFFRGRFLRLMPAVWICASLAFVVLLVGDFVPLKELIRRYLTSLALIPKQWSWIDPVYWSLCVEVSFYGFILCLLVTNRFRQIALFVGAIGVTSAIVWVMFGLSLVMPGHFGSPFLHTLEHIWNSWKLQLLLVHHGCHFALGVYLWLLLFKGVTPSRLIIAGICFVAGNLEIFCRGKEVIVGARSDLPTMVPPVIWSASILLLIASIVLNGRARAWAGTRVRTIRMLGLMTYPLYLLHQMVGSAVILTLHDRGVPRFVALLFALAICLFASWFIARTLEPGFKRHLQLTFPAMEAWLSREARTLSLLRATTPAAPQSL